MNARVWQLHIRAGKTEEFQEIFYSLVELARRQDGYRGAVALSSGKPEAPDVIMVALWDSAEAIRASEKNLFLTQAIARVLSCCEGVPHITEQEILASDFIATSARVKA
jgi:heme-degrading monooxygenase HmoA